MKRLEKYQNYSPTMTGVGVLTALASSLALCLVDVHVRPSRSLIPGPLDINVCSDKNAGKHVLIFPKGV